MVLFFHGGKGQLEHGLLRHDVQPQAGHLGFQIYSKTSETAKNYWKYLKTINGAKTTEKGEDNSIEVNFKQ